MFCLDIDQLRYLYFINMTRDYVPASKKAYTEVPIENAPAEKNELGTSTRTLADKHNVPYSTLQRRIKN